MIVRRLVKPNSGSTATVRSASSPCSMAEVVASLPSGATRHSASGEGLAPDSDFTLRRAINSFSAGASGATHTEVGRAGGAEFSGSGTRLPSLYSYQPRPVLRPSSPAATRGSDTNEGR